MRFKHHLHRKYHAARQAPLWKWVLVILMIIALPLFFSLVNTSQIQQTLNTEPPTSSSE